MTQLTMYTCKNSPCPFYNIPYQLRENDDGSLIMEFVQNGEDKDYTINCNGCGKERRRDKTTTLKEEVE